MSARLITITGGSGFVGQLLCAGLIERGFRVRVFDRLRGPLSNVLRRRYFGASRSSVGRRCARGIRNIQRRLEPALVKTGVLRLSPDDILAGRDVVAARFEGSYAVIHLAGIAHPNMPGATEADFWRLNYAGAINIFEAARDAGVAKFLFASSGQVYRINKPVRIDQFPILESNYCPTLEEGQSLYGWLKLEFERYLAKAAVNANMQSLSMRLEFPGMQSRTPANFYISTCVENLIHGFAVALDAGEDFAFETLNLADAQVHPGIVDVQAFVEDHWPHVPNFTTENESLLSIHKARTLLGYRPTRDSRYYPAFLARP